MSNTLLTPEYIPPGTYNPFRLQFEKLQQRKLGKDLREGDPDKTFLESDYIGPRTEQEQLLEQARQQVSQDFIGPRTELQQNVERQMQADADESLGYRVGIGGLRDALALTAKNLKNVATDYALTQLQANERLRAKQLKQNVPLPNYNQIGSDIKAQLDDSLVRFIPEVPEPTGDIAKAGRDIVTFISTYIPTAKAMGAFQGTTGQQFVKGELAAVIASQLNYDPKDERIANLVNKLSQDDSFVNSVSGLLASDPNDSEAVGRLKLAVEDAGLAALFFGGAKGIDKLTTKFFSKYKGKFDNVSTDEAKKIKDAYTQTRSDTNARYASNINLDRIKSEESVKQLINQRILDNPDQYTGVRFQSQDVTRELAESMGLDAVDNILDLPINESFKSPQEALAARDILVTSAANIRNMAKDYTAGNLSENQKIIFKEMIDKHDAISAIVQGKTAQAGRILNQYNIMAKEGPISYVRGLEQLQNSARQGSTGKNLDEIAEAIASLPDDVSDASASSTIQKALGSFHGKFQEYWINALLSGPKTHMTNILSNAIVGLYNIPETAIAAGVGTIRTGINKLLRRPLTDRVYWRETPDKMLGALEGGLEGSKLFWNTLKTGKPPDHLTKVEFQEQQIKGTLGNIINIPGRALMAEDAFFKEVANRMSTRALTRRQINSEIAQGFYKVIDPAKVQKKLDSETKQGFYYGLDKKTGEKNKKILLDSKKAINKRYESLLSTSPKTKKIFLDTQDAIGKRYQNLLDKPSDEIVAASKEFGNVQTFTNDLTGFPKAWQNLVASNRGLRYLTPFVRTPYNILAYSAKRSPLGLASKEFRDDLMAGGAKADSALARVIMGTSTSLAAYEATKSGLMTGAGSSDPDRLAGEYVAGVQPYSINWKGKQYSFGRLEPFGTLLGVAADIAAAQDAMSGEEQEEAVGLLTKSIAKNMTNKTFLFGITQATNALSDPERYMDDFLTNIIGSVSPNLLGQLTRAQSDTIYDARDYMDKILNRAGLLPIAEMAGYDAPPAKLNVFGEDRKRQEFAPGGFVSDFISPIGKGEMVDDKTKIEANRLDLQIAPLGRSLRGVPLTNEQYYKFAKDTGQLLKKELDTFVNSSSYDRYQDYEKIKAMKSIIRNVREGKRNEWFSKFYYDRE